MTGRKAQPIPTENTQGLLDDPRQRSIRDACTALTDRTTLWAWPNGRTVPPGTAVASKTANGTPYVLTAHHLFDECGDECPNLVLGNQNVVVEHAGMRAIAGPPRAGFFGTEHDHIDIAAVILSEAGRVALRDIAGLTLGEDSDIQETDVVGIAGFPDFLLEPPDGSHIVRGIFYASIVAGRDQFNRIRMNWSEANVFPESPRVDNFGANGATFHLDCPKGISGGGLWRIHDSAKDALWSPSTHCQVIGIAVAYHDNEQFCEPVEMWRSWLEATEATIDRAA